MVGAIIRPILPDDLLSLNLKFGESTSLTFYYGFVSEFLPISAYDHSVFRGMNFDSIQVENSRSIQIKNCHVLDTSLFLVFYAKSNLNPIYDGSPVVFKSIELTSNVNIDLTPYLLGERVKFIKQHKARHYFSDTQGDIFNMNRL